MLVSAILSWCCPRLVPLLLSDLHHLHYRFATYGATLSTLSHEPQGLPYIEHVQRLYIPYDRTLARPSRSDASQSTSRAFFLPTCPKYEHNIALCKAACSLSSSVQQVNDTASMERRQLFNRSRRWGESTSVRCTVEPTQLFITRMATGSSCKSNAFETRSCADAEKT
jgi:hypothetical protein